MKKLWSWLLVIVFIVMCIYCSFQVHDVRLPLLATYRLPSTVFVKNITTDGWTVSGSGVVYNETGLVLTAKHVVKNASMITIETWSGNQYVALAWFVDEDNDLAVIKFKPKEKLRPVKFNKNICVGQPIFIIGSPFGYSFFNSINTGIISGLYRDGSFFGESDMIQLDIAGNPGNSGCPVYNMKGQVIGILVGGIVDADGMNFVVPASAILEFIGEHYGTEKF